MNALDLASEVTHSEDGTTRQRTYTKSLPAMPVMPEEVATALLLEEKLLSCATRGSFLVLSVPPSRLARAETELLARFPVERVDGDLLFLRLLREVATRLEIEWDLILTADAAAPDSFDGQKLRQLVEMLRLKLHEALVFASRTVLLVNPGLFARYGLMGVLAELRNDTGRTGGPHGLWILIPAVVQSALPKLCGQPVPVISDHQHILLPDAWLDNLHRTAMVTGK